MSTTRVQRVFPGPSTISEEAMNENEEASANTAVEESALKCRRYMRSVNIFSKENGDDYKYIKVNAALTVLYFIILAIYALGVVLGKTRVSQEWRLESQENLKAIPIQVALICSSEWGCFDGWQTSAVNFIEIRHKYEKTQQCANVLNYTVVNAAWAEHDFTTSLCYSDAYDDGLDILIPFDAYHRYGDDTSLKVTVTSPLSSMLVSMDMEPFQRKTIFINQQVKERVYHSFSSDFREFLGLETPGYKIDYDTAEPFQSDLFYDGKNANTTALLRIRLNQLASVRSSIIYIFFLQSYVHYELSIPQVARIVRLSSVSDTFARLGGMHTIVWILLTNLRRLLLRSQQTSIFDILDF